MIQEADQQVKEWAESVLEGVEVSLDAPAAETSGRMIRLYLIELSQAPPPRGGKKRPPFRLLLRYLVSAWAETPEESHRLLGDLVFAAMEKQGFEVEMQPPPLAVWQAFGIAPRPSFFLNVLLEKERPEERQPFVRSPVVVDSSPAVPLYGIVFGPGDVPIMGARVECPSLNLATRTDSSGKFRFMTVPAAPPPALVVTAKGKQLSLVADPRSLAGEPLMIHFNDLEN